jgi:hypothetical protein
MKERAEIADMSKALVDQLLTYNTNNRNVKQAVVERYSRDIKAGNWHITNQGIGVSDEGVLLDGQHRLLALKACNYPKVKMVIVWGLDKETQSYVDQHTKRSARDVFRLSFNASVSSYTPGILNVLARYEPDSGIFLGQGTTMSMDEMYHGFDIYADYIEMVISNSHDATFYTAPVLAAHVFVAAKSLVSNDQVRQFLIDIRTGENLTKTMPAYHLRAFLLSSRRATTKGGSLQFERYSKTKKAIISYAKGESMGALRI